MAYRDTILADTPVLYYEFENALTSAGSITTSATGTVAYTASGMVGSALNPSATQTASVSTTNAFFASKTFSIEAWVKQSTTTFTGYHNLVSRMGTNAVTLSIGGSDTAADAGNTTGTGYGKVNFFVGGSTQNGTLWSTTTVNDGNWHHIVATFDGTTQRIYIDGVERSGFSPFTQSGTITNTANVLIGGQTSTLNRLGQPLDELAIYPSALSATRVSAHYSAAFPATNVTFDADTPTTTVQGIDFSYVGTPQTQTLSPTQDTDLSASGPNPTATTFVVQSLSGSTTGWLGFDASQLPAGGSFVGGTLNLKILTGANGSNITISKVTSPWVAADITTGSMPSTTGSVTLNAFTTGAKTVDVSALGLDTNFYGFKLSVTSGTASHTFASSENATASDRPSLTARYTAPPLNNDYTVDGTGAVSVAANDVTVQTTSTVDLTQATATVSLAANDATVENIVTPNVTVDVETGALTVAVSEPSVALPTVVDFTAGHLDLSANDVTAQVTQGALVDLDTASLSAVAISLTDVNGEAVLPTEDEDAYFRSTMRLVNADDLWFRFNDIAGTTAVERVNGGSRNGFYDGVTLGLNDGPNGRKHISFDGDALFKQEVSGTDENALTPGTLEFSIRTTKKNQFVMAMEDVALSNVGQGAANPMRDLVLVDGHLTYRTWTTSNVAPYTPFISSQFGTFVDIADGNWHHVVIRSLAKMEVWIDGHLDIRRSAGLLSFPDYIGGRPEVLRSLGENYGVLPKSQWFVGDLSETIFYNGKGLTEDQILEQFDNLFGYQPYRADTARAFVRAADAITKGNKKNVLTLNFAAHTMYDSYNGVQFAYSGLAYAGSSNFSAYTADDTDLMFYQYSVHGGYIDERLDESRILDLQKDLNLADFDVINVINYPQTGAEVDEQFNVYDHSNFPGGLTGRQQLERLVGQIRTAVVDGKALFLTDPGLAVALGVIDRVEFVPNLRERNITPTVLGGIGQPHYDYHSAIINPWVGLSSTVPVRGYEPRQAFDPTLNYEREASFYYDNYAVSKQRVLTLVDGLTDISGDIVTDWVDWVNYQGDGNHVAAKYAQRPTGLTVGDEFYLMGIEGPGRAGLGGVDYVGAPISPFMRAHGFVAAPIANVKSGTVVTSFNSTQYVGTSLTANPYRDYAVSVVVRPGDLLGGQVISGRIFMNFTEAFNDRAPWMMHSVEDVVPDNSDISNGAHQETAESRQWNLSTWRGSWQSSRADLGNESTASRVYMDEDGNLVVKNDSRDLLVGAVYTARWPRRLVDTPTMSYRGLKWLTSTIDQPGTATVGVATATVEVKANDIATETKSSVAIDFATARVTTQANTLTGVTDPDVSVLLHTAELTLDISPLREVVEFETATIALQAYNDFDGIFRDADLVVMRLPGTEAILTMEER